MKIEKEKRRKLENGEKHERDQKGEEADMSGKDEEGERCEKADRVKNVKGRHNENQCEKD